MKKNKALGGVPITYNVVPTRCEAMVTTHDGAGGTKSWRVSVENPFGRVNSLTEHHNGKVHRSRESLKESSVTRVVLICEHEVDLSEVDA